MFIEVSFTLMTRKIPDNLILLSASCRQVRIIRLVGMMLVVYVKKSLKNFIKEVAAEHVGTGIMGKMVGVILN